MAVVMTEGKYTAEFLLSEAHGFRSRENVVVLSGENLQPGHVLGRRLVAPTVGAAAALGTNTGNGTVGSLTAGTGVQRGTYRLVATEPGSNAGVFQVIDPQGRVIGDATVAVGYTGEINFTIADGATDFIAGDAFTIEVSGGSYKVKEYDAADTDGGHRPFGVLYAAVNATAGDARGVALVRDCEVRIDNLVWFAGATTGQKNAAYDLLASQGVIARP